MTDDLSPASEPEQSYSLKQAARLTGVPANRLRTRCAEGSLSCWKEPLYEGDPNPAWRIPHSALVASGLLAEGSPPQPLPEPRRPSSVQAEALLLPPSAEEAPALHRPPEPLGPSTVEFLREVLSVWRSDMVPDIKGAGQTELLRQLLTIKEEEVALLQGRLEKADAALEWERCRPLTWGERWTGQRRKQTP